MSCMRAVCVLPLLLFVITPRVRAGQETGQGHRSGAPVGLVPSGIAVRVRRGTLTPTVVLPGEVKSTSARDVISHYRWFTSIRWLAPEGSLVRKGDVVAIVGNDDYAWQVQGKVRWLPQRQASELALRERTKLDAIDRSHTALKAKWRLEKAELALRAMAEGPDAADVSLAEIAVRSARLKLDAAEKALNRLHGLSNAAAASEEELARREHEAALAKLALEKAQEDLRALKSGAPKLDLVAARAEVDAAKVELLSAQKEAGAASRKEAAELARLHEDVESYRVSVAARVDIVDKFRRVAPMSGLVVLPPLYLGGKARVGTPAMWTVPIMTIVDPRSVAFVARATERQVAKLAVGQPVTVSVDALPGKALAGEVVAIAMTSEDLSLKGRFGEREERRKTGVRVYDVTVKLDAPPEGTALERMGGTATVEVGEPVEGVVVPRACVKESAGSFRVLAWRDGRWQPIELQIARWDEDRFVVASGLAAGEKVAILAN